MKCAPSEDSASGASSPHTCGRRSHLYDERPQRASFVGARNVVPCRRDSIAVACRLRARAGAQCQPLSSHKVRQAKSRRNRQQTSAHGVKQAATKADVLKHLVASYKHCVRCVSMHAHDACDIKNRNNFRNTNIAESRSEKRAVPACMHA